MDARLALAAFILSAALPALAADSGGSEDVEHFLDTAPVHGQAVDAAGSGVRRKAANVGSANGPARELDEYEGVGLSSMTKRGTGGDGGLVSPTLGRRQRTHTGSATSGATDAATKTGLSSAGHLPAASTTGGQTSTQGGTAGSGDWPPFVKTVKFQVSSSLKAMPEHRGSHGIARIRSAADGVAVGFKTMPDPDGTGARTGVAGLGQMPDAWADDACNGWFWISETAGGPPASDTCREGPIGPGYSDKGGGLSLSFVVPGGRAPQRNYGFGACVLKPGKQYYLNVATSGWERNDEFKPTRCDTGIASPLGDQNWQPD